MSHIGRDSWKTVGVIPNSVYGISVPGFVCHALNAYGCVPYYGSMAAEPQSRAPLQTSLRVLLIEDDPTVRTILSSYLVERGHLTSTAGTRREGIAALSNGRFDVVVTDVLLPDGDGIDVMNRVSRLESPGRIVAITGGGRYFGPGFFHRVAAALGAIVLEKPFGREEFIAAVESGVAA
jgi:CheY-like chemotaxis protein